MFIKDIFKKENRIIFLNSLLFALLSLTYFLNFDYFPITKFDDRVIGGMVLNNFNTMGLINTLCFALFIAFPILFLICFKIIFCLYKNIPESISKFNGKISFFGLISYFFGFFSFINNQKIFSVFFLAFILGFITILNIILYKRNKKIKNYSNLFLFSILISIPFSMIISLFVHRLNLFDFSNHIIFIIIYMFCNVVVFYCFRRFNFNKLVRSFLIFFSSLIIHPLYLEAYNILNQYNIVISHKLLILMLIYVLLFLLSVVYYRCFAKDKDINYRKYYFVIIIIGLSLLSAARGLVTYVDTEFFESANHGMSIFELFKYAKIPIIENFDAHLFSNQILGILYGILNRDMLGSIFLIYDPYKFVVLLLIVYYILKYFLDEDYAFLSILVIPFAKDATLICLFLGLIPIFTFVNAINKKTFKSFLLFWFSLAIDCVCRLDIGFAISMSCVVLLIYLLILDYKKYNIKNIVISFLIVVISFLTFYIVVCLVKDINPVFRLIEFLKISLSNNNWAYTSIGSSNNYSYYLYYYIVPIINIISLGYLLVVKYRKYDNQTLVLIILGLFYFFDFQRGLVRHSLLENVFMYILSYSIIYYSFFVYYFGKKNKSTPVLIYSILLVVCGLSVGLTFKDYNSLTVESANKELSYYLEDQYSDKKINRVVLSDKMLSEFKGLKKVLPLLLKDGETYLDFSNQTIFYALLGYEKPVYVNQSPGLLSGEFTQQMFIREIKNFKGGVPIAIKAKNKNFSNSLDEVPNDFRYYLISEYIYSNYILLANVNGYEIWAKKSYYEDAKKILNKNNIKIYEDTDIKYNKNKKIKLSYIPYVWGKEDIDTKVFKKLNVTKVDHNYGIDVKVKNIDKTNGNYLIFRIDNPSNGTYVKLNIISKNRIVDKLEFYVPEGVNTYKIRISSLYSWYFNNIDKFELSSKINLKIEDVYISKGDVLKKVKS